MDPPPPSDTCEDRVAAPRPKLSILRPEVDSRLDGSHLVNVNGSLVVSSNDDSRFNVEFLNERKVMKLM